MVNVINGPPWREPLNKPVLGVDACDPQGEPGASPNRGAHTACRIIDEVCEEFEDGDEIKITVASMVATIAAAKVEQEPRTRPSGKLPGWGLLIEVCADADSNMGIVAMELKSVTVLRVTAEVDWTDPATVRQVVNIIKANPGASVHGSLPCTPWTQWAYMNLHRYGEDFAAALAEARRISKAMLAAFILVAELAMRLGGEASFEWPNSCVG